MRHDNIKLNTYFHRDLNNNNDNKKEITTVK